MYHNYKESTISKNLLLLALIFDIIYMIGKRDNMNKKGQALIEFVLILPVLLLIIMTMIDVGNIFIKKYELNKDLETISDLYQNNENKQLAAYIASEEIKFEEKPVGNMVKLTITKDINIAAPILSNVLGKEYKISLSKMVYASYEGINGQ